MKIKNNSKKTLKYILLTTAFTSLNRESYGAEDINKIESSPSQIYKIENATVDIAILCYDIIFDSGIKILNNDGIALEDKVTWIHKAFANLKEMTDIACPIKYADKLDIPGFTEKLLRIEEWDAKKRSFNPQKFHFQYTIPNSDPNATEKLTKTNLLISDIPENEITPIITILLTKLTKKAFYLKAFSGIEKLEYEDIKEDSERKATICNLFKEKHINNKIKANFSNLVTDHIQKRNKKINNDSPNKIKLLYNNQTDLTLKYTDVKVKLEKSWGAYLKGIELITKPTNSPETKNLFKNILATKTLPDAMIDIETQRIDDYYCYLRNRNKILEKIYDSTKANSPVSQFNPESTKNQFIRYVLEQGQYIINNLPKFTLENKKSWIIEACSSLKIFEEEITSRLYGPFYNPNAYKYPFWNENTHVFIGHKDFKFALPLINDPNPIFLKLNELDQSYADTIIIPILLTQLFKENQKCVFWEKKINLPIDMTALNKLDHPQEIISEILGLIRDKKKYEKDSENLLNDYLDTIGFFSYDTNLRNNPHFQAPVCIKLDKVPSGNSPLFDTLIADASYYESEFSTGLEQLRLRQKGEISEEHTPLFADLFLKFQNSLLENYKLADLDKVINILRYMNAMTSQLNATISGDIETKRNEEKNNKLTIISKNLSNSKMTSKKRMQAKRIQNVLTKTTTPILTASTKQNEEKTTIQEPKTILNLPKLSKPKSTKDAPYQKTKKKTKSGHRVPDTGNKTPPKMIPSISAPTEDPIKLVTLAGGKLGVSVPGVSYKDYYATQSQDRKTTPKTPPQITESKKRETIQIQNRPQPVDPTKNTRNTKRPTHQSQVQSPQKTTWSTVVEGITPLVLNDLASSIPMTPAPLSTAVEIPPILAKMPQKPHKHRPETILPIAPNREPQILLPAAEQKEIIPVIKNGTTFYHPKTDEIVPQYDGSPQAGNVTPAIYNYMVPGNNYDQSNLFVPHTGLIIPTEDVDHVIVQITTPENQNKKMKNVNHDKEVKVVTYIYHRYPEGTKTAEDLPNEKNVDDKRENPIPQVPLTESNSSRTRADLPRNPLPSRRLSLGDLSSETFYKTMNK